MRRVAASQPASQANLWHAAGVANGGKPIEDPPGARREVGELTNLITRGLLMQ
jgi:hypothetical protein